MADLTVKQKQIFDDYKKTHPQMRDDEILSALVNLGKIQLTEEQKLSLFIDHIDDNFNMGLSIEKEQTNKEKQPIDLPEYKEKQLLERLKQKVDNVAVYTKYAEENNGFIGKAWNWIKNKTGRGDSSNKVKELQKEDLKTFQKCKTSKEAFEKLTGLEFNEKNIEDFLNDYEGKIKIKSEKALDAYREGQEMAVSVVGDIATGLLAGVAVAGAPLTFQTFAMASMIGMASKAIFTGIEGLTGGRDFFSSFINPDAFGSGLITGLLTPLTFGVGGAITNTFGKIAGKSLAGKAATFAIREGAVGAIWGGGSEGGNELMKNGFSERTLEKTVEGAIGGAFTGVLMSGAFKGIGKTYSKIKNRNLDEFGNKIEKPKKPEKPRKPKTLEGGVKDTELEEVAPFAKRLEETPQIKLAKENYEKLEASVMSKIKDKTNPEELELAQTILNRINPKNERIVKMMLEDGTFSNELILSTLDSFTIEGIQNPILAMFALQHMIGPVAQFKNNAFKIKNAEKLLGDILSKKSNIPKEQLPDIIRSITKKNQQLCKIADEIEGFDYSYLPAILKSTLHTDTTNTIVTSAGKVKFAKWLMSKKDIPYDCIADIVQSEHLEPKLAKYLCERADVPKQEISDILRSTQMVHGEWAGLFGDKLGYKVPMIYRLVEDVNCPNEVISDIVKTIDSKQLKIFEKLYADSTVGKNEISGILQLEYALRRGKKLDFRSKVETLIASAKVTPQTLDNLERYGLDKKKILKLIEDINMEMGGAKNYHIKTDKAKQQVFLSKILANNNSKTETILKDLDLTQFKKGLPLKYPRTEFINDVKKLLSRLEQKEQEKVLEYFNLKFIGNDFESIPHVKLNSTIKFDEKTAQVVNAIKEKLDDFTIRNEVKIENNELKAFFDDLVQGLPEFTTVIGKQQHGKHAYTVDIHSLKVLQNAMKNPDYAKLTNKDKTILKLSVLLHDLGKQAGVIDEGHYELSARYAIGILEKFKLPDNVKSRVVELINNHHWFEGYNKGKTSPEFIASLFRTENDLNIAKIMAKADLEGVSSAFHYTKTGTHTQKAFDDFMQSKFWAIDAAHQRVQTTASIVMNSKFRQTVTRHFPMQKVLIKGKEYEIPVLNLMDDNVSYNLEQYGFAPGVTKETARFIVHMQNHIPNLKVFMSLSQSPTTNSVQSMSVISKNNNRTFQNYIYGVVGEVDSQNISQAYFSNISSGYKKSMKSFSQGLFTSWDYRTYLRNEMVKELKKHQININTEEYAKLSEYLQQFQYLSQITKDFKIGDKIISASTLREVINKTTDALFEGGNIHSELVVLNPKVKALIARVSSIEECSQEFLEMAQQNNLPIILTGFKNGF